MSVHYSKTFNIAYSNPEREREHSLLKFKMLEHRARIKDEVLSEVQIQSINHYEVFDRLTGDSEHTTYEQPDFWEKADSVGELSDFDCGVGHRQVDFVNWTYESVT